MNDTAMGTAVSLSAAAGPHLLSQSEGLVQALAHDLRVPTYSTGLQFVHDEV